MGAAAIPLIAGAAGTIFAPKPQTVAPPPVPAPAPAASQESTGSADSKAAAQEGSARSRALRRRKTEEDTANFGGVPSSNKKSLLGG